jgi:hypothetical protein
MTTRDGVGFHKNNLAEFDLICFVCPLPRCAPESKFCPWNILDRLREIEQEAGGDPARVLETLSSRKSRGKKGR